MFEANATAGMGLGIETREPVLAPVFEAGTIAAGLRKAMERRAGLVIDLEFCRLVNGSGDHLPGLYVDRYDGHYGIQTATEEMDEDVATIAKTLYEVTGARSVILRNDSARRVLWGRPRAKRQQVLLGMPPRWTRIRELGARITVDLYSGAETGYRYELREVRQTIAHIATNARVLELSCHVGGRVVHAGLGGARQVVAFDAEEDAVELTRENIELNGLMGRAHVELAPPTEALAQVHSRFDLVLLDMPGKLEAGTEAAFELLRGAVRATRQGGRLLLSGSLPGFDAGTLARDVAEAVRVEGRSARSLLRLGAPGDFPTPLSEREPVAALLVEVD